MDQSLDGFHPDGRSFTPFDGDDRQLSLTKTRVVCEILTNAFEAGTANEHQHEASVIAAEAHRLYRQRGGTKTSPMPDFYIGAHARVAGCRLLTRDDGRFKTYFLSVELITPGMGVMP